MPKPKKTPYDSSTVVDLSDIGLPEVPLLGFHRLTTATKGLGEHVHRGIFEICYLASGMRTYHVDGKDYPFKGGELFVTFPGERHGSGRHVHGKGALYWLHILSDPLPKSFLGLGVENSQPLLDALRNLPNRCFKGDHRFQDLAERLFRLRREGEGNALARVESIGLLLELLSLVVHWSNKASEALLSSEIEESSKYIKNKIEENFSLENLAERANLSLSRYKARFRQEMGMPPKEFILREKVDRARELLRNSSLSVTKIAHHLGFSTSQYFATVYKRYTNSSPSLDRRKRS